ncbi:MAG: competence/damage-inducible protein A [Ruminococcaceae bacterium]|nr:competence/damage-inducible protein A [Oscillospiraceae bacterium]
MIAEILCIGTEILIGDIVNTNATYISKRLSEYGFDVLYHSVCGDNKVRLEETLKHAFKRADLVVTTGGLGPTYDDITTELCAKALGLGLHKDENVEKQLYSYFEKTGRKMTENNLKQAMVPDTSTVLMNDFGTAPGIAVEKDGKVLVMLPGPPREMKPMLENQVIPYLSKYTDHVLVSSNVNIIGMGESSVEEKLYDLMTKSKNPTLAPYVNEGEVRVRVTARGKNEVEARKLISKTVEEVKTVLGRVVYDVDSPSVEHSLVKLLSEKKKTIATCESCTGGLVSASITAVPGSSEVFGFGVCTYANEAKMRLVGVKADTLEKYGAVSEQTAMEMAEGVRKLSGADIALSLTGIAGPGGSSDEKPVGLVYLGVSVGDKLYAKRMLLGQHATRDREYIRKLAVKNALMTAIDEVMEL